jgi:transposase InsO family protein
MPAAEAGALDAVLASGSGELYLARPFYGSWRMVAVLRRDGWAINRKRVRWLMRLMGLEAIYQKPNTSAGHPAHPVYPYLLRDLVIERVNRVWCADITYVPMAKGFVYLVAVMDWFSRRVLSWRRSIGLGVDFVLRLCGMRWSGMIRRTFSIRIRGFSLRARRLLARCRAAAFG